MDQIIIKQTYFDNIKTAVDGINQFFESGFQTKNFPADTTELDWGVANVVELLEDLDPVYVSDTEKMNQVLDDIQTRIEAKGDASTDEIMTDRPIRNAVESIISFTALQDIADNFDTFSKFINGIYTFELFMNPSKYRKEIDTFTNQLQLPAELEDLNIDTSIFSVEAYVMNLMNNPDITFPDTMNTDNEVQRILEYRDLQNTEVVVDNTTPETNGVNNTNQPVQEHVSTINDIPDIKCVKYFPISNKFKLSDQGESFVTKLTNGIRNCDSLTDLKSFITEFKIPKTIDLPVPYILESALSGNDSNNRCGKYTIYDACKVDKDSLIKYIEDYYSLDLVNSSSAVISNNILLEQFNSFDSPRYLNSVISKKYKSKSRSNIIQEEAIQISSRINTNSHNVNSYTPSAKKLLGDPNKSTDDIQESVDIRFKAFGDMDTSDIVLCESYKQMLYDEISTVGDKMYNKKVSPSKINQYIGESYIQMESSNFKDRPEARGELPDYMKSRMDLSDGEEEEKKPSTTEVPDPVMDPQNPIDDLADSVDDKMGMDGNLDEVIGSGFESNPNRKKGNVVYNITYNNSFNKNDLSSNMNSKNTTNDLSSNKTSTKTNTSNSHNTSSSSDSHDSIHDSYNKSDRSESIGSIGRDVNLNHGKNNNDNSSDSLDSKESNKASHPSEHRKLSNGMTVREMFTFLESEEPLSNEFTSNTNKPPKEDSLTRAMDRDRKSRSKLQQVDKSVQKAGNTVRATLKPVARVKKWLTGVVNTLVERDENKVKEEIIENPSYRTSLYKAMRLALKLGLTGIAFTISGYLGVAYTGWNVLRFTDKQRLRREVQDEMVTELQIMDEKIAHAKEEGNQQELYKLMRLRSKMEGIAADASRGRWRGVKQDMRK